jgi:cell division protein FtsB
MPKPLKITLFLTFVAFTVVGVFWVAALWQQTEAIRENTELRRAENTELRRAAHALEAENAKDEKQGEANTETP